MADFSSEGPFQKPRIIKNVAIGSGANPTLATFQIEAKGGPLPAIFEQQNALVAKSGPDCVAIARL